MTREQVIQQLATKSLTASEIWRLLRHEKGQQLLALYGVSADQINLPDSDEPPDFTALQHLPAPFRAVLMTGTGHPIVGWEYTDDEMTLLKTILEIRNAVFPPVSITADRASKAPRQVRSGTVNGQKTAFTGTVVPTEPSRARKPGKSAGVAWAKRNPQLSPDPGVSTTARGTRIRGPAVCAQRINENLISNQEPKRSDPRWRRKLYVRAAAAYAASQVSKF
jgi:hypothetical protein